MSIRYENAKQVALGLIREQKEEIIDDIWGISLDDDFGMTGELGFQFFERGFEEVEEQIMQKGALKLYSSEYEADRKAAVARLKTLEQALADSDLNALKACLNEVHPEEWLSLIFLDGKQLKDELVPLLEVSSPECRTVFSAAMEKALKRLVDFKDLLESLKMCCDQDIRI